VDTDRGWSGSGRCDGLRCYSLFLTVYPKVYVVAVCLVRYHLVADRTIRYLLNLAKIRKGVSA
jgi:hypothetical protein